MLIKHNAIKINIRNNRENILTTYFQMKNIITLILSLVGIVVSVAGGGGYSDATCSYESVDAESCDPAANGCGDCYWAGQYPGSLSCDATDCDAYWTCLYGTCAGCADEYIAWFNCLDEASCGFNYCSTGGYTRKLGQHRGLRRPLPLIRAGGTHPTGSRDKSHSHKSK